MASAPIPRKVPSGNWYCIAIAHRKPFSVPNPRRLALCASPLLQPPKYKASTRLSPITVPRRLPTKSVRNVPRKPRNAPTMAIIFTSPMPNPSRPRTALYPVASPHSKKLPNAAPRSPSSIPAANPGIRNRRNRHMRNPANPGSGGTNAENISPAANPGQLTTSGSSRARNSVTASISIKQVKNSHYTVARVTPNSTHAATNTNPLASSTSGYIAAIGAPQELHFPRSSSHENTGTLSDGLVGVPHRG